VLAVSLPAAVGLAVIREPVVTLLFERGRFGAEAAARAAGVTLWYALAVAPASCLPVLARGHHAWADTRTPVRIGAACVGLNLVLNLLLVQVLAERGLALATAVSAAVQAVWLGAALRPRADLAWRRDVAGPVARMAAAAGAAGLAAFGALAAAQAWGPAAGTPAAATRCAAAMAAGIAAYLVVARVAGVAELAALWRRRR